MKAKQGNPNIKAGKKNPTVKVGNKETSTMKDKQQ